MSEQCKICGEWIYQWTRHTCAPTWLCCCPEWAGEGEWETIHAHDAEEAAEKYAEISDDGNDLPQGGGVWIVQVKLVSEEGATVEEYAVSADYSIIYSATIQQKRIRVIRGSNHAVTTDPIAD